MGWGYMSIGDPSKSHQGRSGFFKKMKNTTTKKLNSVRLKSGKLQRLICLVFSNRPTTPPSRAQQVALGTVNTDPALAEKDETTPGNY